MTPPLLALHEVAKEYGAGRAKVVAVDGVSLEIRSGEIVLVMGPSGCGKTTLLSMMGCILRPTRGRIRLDGAEVSGLPESALPRIRRRHVGFIFQSFNLLSALTARENVEVALNLGGTRGAAAACRARELLETVDLADRLDFLPADLSGGEKQRVSIARALANEPTLLLADEPTANLDSQNGQLVTELLSRLAREKGRAVVIVTHDTRISSIADRVLYLEDGRIVS